VPNPILGVFLHWLGGLASASFYVPYRKVTGMVVGDLLAGWRGGQLDCGSVGDGGRFSAGTS